jgi:splicing factor U2AF subunit
MKVCSNSIFELVDTLTVCIEIYDDVRGECAKYGKILELKIPRPAGARTTPGVGKIFIKFDKVESAQKALHALAGRKFADRTVVAAYFGEVIPD